MPQALQAPGTLLLIKPGSLGDVIHALPCAAAIRQAWPHAEITWVIDERWAPLLEGNPDITSIKVFPRQHFRGLTGKTRAVPWALGLRALQPDIALDLQGLLRSAMMARLSGATRIHGLADAREGARWFYNHSTPVVSGEHSVRRYLRTLDGLGIPIPEKPVFPLPKGIKPVPWIEKGAFVLLHPYARGTGKSLTEQDVQTLCQRLSPFPVVVAGMGKITQPLSANAINMLGQTTLDEMVWLLRAARFVLSVDSGPMHIAAAAGVPLLSIHTWSDPRLVGPFSESAWIWQGGEIRPQSLQPCALPPPSPLQASHVVQIGDWLKTQL